MNGLRLFNRSKLTNVKLKYKRKSNICLMIYFTYYYGSGPLNGKILLVMIIENNKKLCLF